MKRKKEPRQKPRLKNHNIWYSGFRIVPKYCFASLQLISCILAKRSRFAASFDCFHCNGALQTLAFHLAADEVGFCNIAIDQQIGS